MRPERRKFHRYKLSEENFAGAYPCVGEIADLSINGLAFRYLGLGQPEPQTESMTLYGREGGCLSGLKCRIIADRVIPRRSSLSNIFVHERRVQFVNLSAEQKKYLSEFIENYKIQDEV
ncbi:PilZ domain-containing protein [Desulfobacterota bacterium M19]